MTEDQNVESGRPQLLVVVLDINPSQLLFARNPSSLPQILSSVLQLLNSHLMLSPSNSCALLAAHGSGCTQLFPQLASNTGQAQQPLRQQDGQYESFYQVETLVRQGVQKLVTSGANSGGKGESLLSGALHKALCYINKVSKAASSLATKPEARILALSGTGDSAAHYINYMNAFFTAQKLNIPVDTCMLGVDSGLLQQGSDITGGLYLKVEQLGGLLQYLVWLFLPSPCVRGMLGAPPPVKVDYRAACFCHRQLVDVGYVCSVCLSIFCKFSPVCTTCHSVFKAPGLPPVKKKKVSDKK